MVEKRSRHHVGGALDVENLDEVFGLGMRLVANAHAAHVPVGHGSRLARIELLQHLQTNHLHRLVSHVLAGGPLEAVRCLVTSDDRVVLFNVATLGWNGLSQRDLLLVVGADSFQRIFFELERRQGAQLAQVGQKVILGQLFGQRVVIGCCVHRFLAESLGVVAHQVNDHVELLLEVVFVFAVLRLEQVELRVVLHRGHFLLVGAHLLYLI